MGTFVSIIIGLVIALIVGWSIVSTIRSHSKGTCSCGSPGCSGCSGCVPDSLADGASCPACAAKRDQKRD